MIEIIFFDTVIISIIFCAGLIIGFTIGCYIGMSYVFKRDIKALIDKLELEKKEKQK